ncbi:hypothetical protein FI667_g9225, partial [Globisporangium splendens]
MGKTRAQGLRHADSVAAQEFEAASGDFFEVVQVVPAPVGQVFDDWLQKLWIDNFRITVPGEGRGLVGNERAVDAFGVVEKIVRAGLPMPDNSQIASITYIVTKFGKFPWSRYLGFVQFVPSSDGKSTTLIASSKTSPKLNADGTTVDDSRFRLALQKSIAVKFAALAKSYSIESKLLRGSTWFPHNEQLQTAAQSALVHSRSLQQAHALSSSIHRHSTMVSTAGLKFTDAVGAQEFDAATATHAFALEQVVPAPVGQVFDAYLKRIWLGKFKITAPGEGRGLVGNERFIDAFGVVEKILRAGVPAADNSQVASITYAVTKFGKFPWIYHLGFVQFVPSADGKSTTVVVGSKTTPKKNADGTPIDDSKLRNVLKKGIAAQLAALAKSYSADSKL